MMFKFVFLILLFSQVSLAQGSSKKCMVLTTNKRISISLHQKPNHVDDFEFCKLRSIAFIAARSSEYKRLNMYPGNFGKIVFQPQRKDQMKCNYKVLSDLANDVDNANYSLIYGSICNSSKERCYDQGFKNYDEDLLELIFTNEQSLKDAIELSCDNENLLS